VISFRLSKLQTVDDRRGRIQRIKTKLGEDEKEIEKEVAHLEKAITFYSKGKGSEKCLYKDP